MAKPMMSDAPFEFYDYEFGSAPVRSESGRVKRKRKAKPVPPRGNIDFGEISIRPAGPPPVDSMQDLSPEEIAILGGGDDPSAFGGGSIGKSIRRGDYIAAATDQANQGLKRDLVDQQMGRIKERSLGGLITGVPRATLGGAIGAGATGGLSMGAVPALSGMVAGGAVGGLGSQFGADMANGTLSSPEQYAAAGLIGGATGGVLGRAAGAIGRRLPGSARTADRAVSNSARTMFDPAPDPIGPPMSLDELYNPSHGAKFVDDLGDHGLVGPAFGTEKTIPDIQTNLRPQPFRTSPTGPTGLPSFNRSGPSGPRPSPPGGFPPRSGTAPATPRALARAQNFTPPAPRAPMADVNYTPPPPASPIDQSPSGSFAPPAPRSPIERQPPTSIPPPRPSIEDIRRAQFGPPAARRANSEVLMTRRNLENDAARNNARAGVEIDESTRNWLAEGDNTFDNFGDNFDREFGEFLDMELASPPPPAPAGATPQVASSFEDPFASQTSASAFDPSMLGGVPAQPQAMPMSMVDLPSSPRLRSRIQPPPAPLPMSAVNRGIPNASSAEGFSMAEVQSGPGILARAAPRPPQYGSINQQTFIDPSPLRAPGGLPPDPRYADLSGPFPGGIPFSDIMQARTMLQPPLPPMYRPPLRAPVRRPISALPMDMLYGVPQ